MWQKLRRNSTPKQVSNKPNDAVVTPRRIASLRSKGKALFKPSRAVTTLHQNTSAMPLTMLPNELILMIAECLGAKPLNSLLQTCRRFNLLLTPMLHDRALEDHKGVSSLIRAAERGHEPLARLLIQRGVEVNRICTVYIDVGRTRRMRRNKTALEQAVRCGQEAIVELLLDNGADIHHVTSRHDISLLHIAVELENERITRLLIKRGLRISRVEGMSWKSLPTVCV